LALPLDKHNVYINACRLASLMHDQLAQRPNDQRSYSMHDILISTYLLLHLRDICRRMRAKFSEPLPSPAPLENLPLSQNKLQNTPRTMQNNRLCSVMVDCVESRQLQSFGLCVRSSEEVVLHVPPIAAPFVCRITVSRDLNVRACVWRSALGR